MSSGEVEPVLQRAQASPPRHWLHRLGAALVACLAVVFMGTDASADVDPPVTSTQLLYTLSPPPELSADGRSIASMSWFRNAVPGTGTNAIISIVCHTSEANVTASRAAITSTTSGTGAGTYNDRIVDLGSTSGTYSYSGQAGDRCPDNAPFFVGIVGHFGTSGDGSRAWWWPAQDNSNTAVCNSGVLANVYVWETSEGVGYSFEWTGSTNWSRWRIHKSGNLNSTYGNLDGFVTNGAYTGFWRSNNDPASTSVFAPGDLVKFRRFGSSSAGQPTSCWVEVTVMGTAYDWRLNGAPAGGGGSSGGPTDYGDATDPDSSESCSAFDIACRIRSALEWAFVPSSSTLEQFDAIGEDVESKVPFVWITGAWTLTGYFLPQCEDDGINATQSSCANYSYAQLMTFDVSQLTGSNDDVRVLPVGDPILDWMRDKRDIFTVVMYVLLLAPIGFWAWKRLMPMAGSGNQ